MWTVQTQVLQAQYELDFRNIWWIVWLYQDSCIFRILIPVILSYVRQIHVTKMMKGILDNFLSHWITARNLALVSTLNGLLLYIKLNSLLVSTEFHHAFHNSSMKYCIFMTIYFWLKLFAYIVVGLWMLMEFSSLSFLSFPWFCCINRETHESDLLPGN